MSIITDEEIMMPLPQFQEYKKLVGYMQLLLRFSYQQLRYLEAAV